MPSASSPEWVVFYAPQTEKRFVSTPNGLVTLSDEVTSEDVGNDPSLVPARGVVACVWPNDNGQRIMWGTPYYVWREKFGKFYECSQVAMWFYLSEPGWKRVLFGEYITDEEMNAVLVRAARYFPKKTTWRKDERPDEGR